MPDRDPNGVPRDDERAAEAGTPGLGSEDEQDLNESDLQDQEQPTPFSSSEKEQLSEAGVDASDFQQGQPEQLEQSDDGSDEAAELDDLQEEDEPVEEQSEEVDLASQTQSRESSEADQAEEFEEELEDEFEDAEDAELEADDDDASDDEEEAEEADEDGGKKWYVLKVQSNREDSIRDAILRRVKMAGLEEHLGEIVVPTEKVSEIKGGKKRVTERKFFPGYIMVNVDLNHDIWFIIRETPGVGDFVGANNQPVPMSPEDVDRMLGREAATEVAQPRLKINFDKGDRVKIKEGTFENFEGDVEEVIEAKGVVRVMIQIFGRPTPVELEYWQVEPV